MVKSIQGQLIQNQDITQWSNNLLEFGDRLYAYGYVSSTDNNPYLAVIQNGVLINTFRVSTRAIEGALNICKVQNNMVFFVYCSNVGGNKDVQAQLIDLTGNLIGAELLNIDGVTTTVSLHSETCVHIAGTQRIGLTYARYIPATMWDIYYIEYDFGNQVLINGVILENRNGRQYGSKISQLQGPNSNLIMAFYFHNPTTSTITQAYDINTNATVAAGSINQPFFAGSPSQVTALPNGGYILLAQNSQFIVYDQTHTEVCRDTIGVFQAYGTLVGNNYYVVGTTGVQELYGYQVQLDNACNIIGGNLLYRNIDSNQVSLPVIAYSQNSHTSLLSIVFYLANSIRQHLYLEYLEDNLIACPRQECFGCLDGTDTCPVCSGATPMERLIRWSDDGNCMCRQGYYHDNILFQCTRCLPECETCNNGSDCQTCSAVYANPPSCSCVFDIQQNPIFEIHQHQFDDAAGFRNINTISLDQCKTECRLDSSCLSFEYYQDNSQCILQNTVTNSLDLIGGAGQGMTQVIDYVNYYVKLSTLITQCPCNYKCATCIATATACNTCLDANRAGPTCECIPNFYDDGSNAACVPCTYPCQTCTDSTTCLTCVTTANRVSVTDCNCMPEYFDNNSSCASCIGPCFTCTGTATNCTSTCNYKCGSCSGTQTACGTCSDANRAGPTCECVPNFYDDGSNAACIPCTYPCQTCTDSTTCLTCVTTADRVSVTDCNCMPEFYDNNSSCASCVGPCFTCTGTATNCTSTCNYKCGSCSGTQTACGTCSDSNRAGPTCECVPNFYDDGSNAACIPCTYPCQTCTDSTTCLTCSTTANRVSVTDCDCIPGYFDNNSSCQRCDGPCLTCSGSASNCTSYCDYKCNDCIQHAHICKTCSSEKRIMPECNCNFNYFDDGVNSECIPCSSKCEICDGNPDICLTCADSNRLPPQCICQDGFYEDSSTGECSICPPKCNKCIDNQTCVECTNTNLNPPYCQSELKNMLIVNNIKSDLKCNPQCEQCNQTQDNCSQCIQGYKRIQQLPSCACEPGYHDNSGTSKNCYECSSTCKTCSSYQKCTQCFEDQNRVLDIQSNQCICKKGYKISNKFSLKCEKCYTYQNECLIKCPTNTKKDDNSYTCHEKEKNIIDFFIIILICGITILFSLTISKYTLQFKIKGKSNQNEINKIQKQNKE